MKPVAIDVCCRKGGVTKGLQRAGFYVIGIDVEPQPGYPGDEFVQMDGLEVLRRFRDFCGVWGIDPTLVWQSWPCQFRNTATASNRARGLTDEHPDLLPLGRELSDRLGIPYVLEQPTSSVKGTIRSDLILCMDMFKGELPPPWVQKHRSFEFGHWPGPLPTQPEHPAGPVRGPSVHPFKPPAGHAGYVRGHRHNVVRRGAEAPYVAGYGKGGGKAKVWELRHAMGIDWMDDLFDLCEAIPPVFAEHIGRSFLNSLAAQGRLSGAAT